MFVAGFLCLDLLRRATWKSCFSPFRARWGPITRRSTCPGRGSSSLTLTRYKTHPSPCRFSGALSGSWLLRDLGRPLPGLSSYWVTVVAQIVLRISGVLVVIWGTLLEVWGDVRFYQTRFSLFTLLLRSTVSLPLICPRLLAQPSFSCRENSKPYVSGIPRA